MIDYFILLKDKKSRIVFALKSEISKTDNEIDRMVYEL
jgi:hypothetical protein